MIDAGGTRRFEPARRRRVRGRLRSWQSADWLILATLALATLTAIESATRAPDAGVEAKLALLSVQAMSDDSMVGIEQFLGKLGTP